MADTGRVIKLKIKAFKNNKYSSPSGDEYDLMINPENYKHEHKIEYQGEENYGGTFPGPKFKRYGTENIGFNIILDATGVISNSYNSNGIVDQIKKLKKTVYDFNGDIHEPQYVQLIWGKMIFNGRLTSFKIDYTLFTPSGIPLRAKIDLDFVGYTSCEERKQKENANSPDMSHLIQIKAGDNIQKLCYNIYKDTAYCRQIAYVNGLSSFRKVKQGMRLLFPPIRKDG